VARFIGPPQEFPEVCGASINQLRFRRDDLVAFLSAGAQSESQFSLNLQSRVCLRISSNATPSLGQPCDDERPQEQESQTLHLAADSHAIAITCPNAALWMDSGGRLYTSAVRAQSEPKLDRSRFRLVVEKDRMHWPPGVGRGPDGALYVSAIQVCRHSVSQGDASPSAVFKISSEMLVMVASAH
jgi:hypothetical protein